MTRRTGWGVRAALALGGVALSGCVATTAVAPHQTACTASSVSAELTAKAGPPAAEQVAGEQVAAQPAQTEPTPAAPAQNVNAFPNVNAPYTLVDIPNPYDAELAEERRTMLRGATERVIAAPADPTRLETQMVNFSAGGTRCSVLGADGLCVRTIDGPFVLTDFAAVGNCSDTLFLGSTEVQERVDAELRVQPAWLVPVSAEGAFGAHFYVAAGERLIAVAKPNQKRRAKLQQCAITWSGFRPRMLPTRGE